MRDASIRETDAAIRQVDHPRPVSDCRPHYDPAGCTTLALSRLTCTT